MVQFQEDTVSHSHKESKKCDCSACTICKFFCREPQFILKVILIVVNIVIMMTIIAGNSVKLRSSVHATHASLRTNTSLYYPSVTICQDPALRGNSSSDFDRNNQINIKNAQLSSGIVFKRIFLYTAINGHCHTLVPQNAVDNVGKRYGFIINVTYHSRQSMDHKSLGWHVFIHDTIHTFNDQSVADGLADYVYLQVDQEMHVKIKATQFERNDYCDSEDEVEECYRQCFMIYKPGSSGCMSGTISNAVAYDCSEDVNLTSLTNEIVMNRTDCTCPRACDLKIYDTYVERTIDLNNTDPEIRGKLLIYYTEKRFLHIREKEVYEWPQFLADLCAVIAFFIGLSMMSIFNILYKFFSMACCSSASLEDSVKTAISAGSRKQSTVL